MPRFGVGEFICYFRPFVEDRPQFRQRCRGDGVLIEVLAKVEAEAWGSLGQ